MSHTWCHVAARFTPALHTHFFPASKRAAGVKRVETSENGLKIFQEAFLLLLLLFHVFKYLLLFHCGLCFSLLVN